MAYGLLRVPCALFLLSVEVLGLYSMQMYKPMHWTYILRTCISVYPAQISKLYSAQISRPVSCPDVYIVRRCLGCILRLCLSLLRKCLCCVILDLYYAQISKHIPAQMSRSILCADVWAYIMRRFLNIYPAQMSRSIYYPDAYIDDFIF
jgi:hypothetical protein